MGFLVVPPPSLPKIQKKFQKKFKNYYLCTMRRKTIEIPIYLCTLTIILAEDLKYVEKKYKTVPLDNFGAVTLRGDRHNNIVVAFTNKDNVSHIAHEIVHVKNYIFLDCAMEVDRINDEPEAYLSGWLFDQIYNFLQRN